MRVKYKQAVLGIAWALIQPLAFLGIFVVFFGRVAKIDGDGMPYAAFALTALIPWNYLATTVSFGANALLSDAALVRKVYFPREVPVLAAAVASCVDFAAGLVAFLVLGPILGAHLTWAALLAPLLLPLVALPAVGLVDLEGIEGEHRKAGVRTESMVVVTANGPEIIDHFPRDEILVAGAI